MIRHAALAFPDIDPIAISLGPFQVRWYALAYVVGLLFAFAYMKRLVRSPTLWTGKPPTMTPEQVDDFFLWATLGVILGGRLGYVLFYDPGYFAAHPLDVVKLWQGGMSFHGGFLGVIIASSAFARALRFAEMTAKTAATTLATAPITATHTVG